MTAELFIITGASRGMGAAMAHQVVLAGHQLIGISRGLHPDLPQPADGQALALQWQADLADAAPVAEQLRTWLQGARPDAWPRATLINNAGMIARLAPLADVPLADTAKSLRVGLEAAMLLSTAFLDGTRRWTGQRRVLNISSGLGRRAMAGSASYCAAKAGMDHFSRALALEEAHHPNGAQIVSLAPGVIATDMQVQLRDADPSAFPDRDNFIQLHQQGRLSSPEAAAARALAWLDRADFGATPVCDVRD